MSKTELFADDRGEYEWIDVLQSHRAVDVIERDPE